MVADVSGRRLSAVVLMVVAAAFAVVQTRSGISDDGGGAVADALGQGGVLGVPDVWGEAAGTSRCSGG